MPNQDNMPSYRGRTVFKGGKDQLTIAPETENVYANQDFNFTDTKVVATANIKAIDELEDSYDFGKFVAKENVPFLPKESTKSCLYLRSLTSHPFFVNKSKKSIESCS